MTLPKLITDKNRVITIGLDYSGFFCKIRTLPERKKVRMTQSVESKMSTTDIYVKEQNSSDFLVYTISEMSEFNRFKKSYHSVTTVLVLIV